MGNSMFPPRIPIISSPATLEKIKEVSFKRIKEFQETAPTEIENRKETLNTETDENKIIEFRNDLAFFDYIMDPNFNLRIPDILINDNIVINGANTSIHLVNRGIGHTESDIVAYFPQEKICFMGDLLFANLEESWAPSQTGSFPCTDPQKLHETLKDLLENDIETYVPGHGDISSKDAVRKNMDFVERHYLNQKSYGN
jgi:glyoxylase-like metal-dependent hydrolase (beta-lactamase superfamily II)